MRPRRVYGLRHSLHSRSLLLQHLPLKHLPRNSPILVPHGSQVSPLLSYLLMQMDYLVNMQEWIVLINSSLTSVRQERELVPVLTMISGRVLTLQFLMEGRVYLLSEERTLFSILRRLTLFHPRPLLLTTQPLISSRSTAFYPLLLQLSVVPQTELVLLSTAVRLPRLVRPQR